MSDRRMFEALVRDNLQALHVYLGARVADPATADDLLQETLVTAWRRLSDYDVAQPFGRWLRGIAHNLVRNRRSRPGRERTLAEDDLHEALDARCDALQRLRNDELDERLERLRQCLRDLPSRYRSALELRYRGEVEPRGIADRLRISLGATHKLLQRGRRMVAECVRRKLAEYGALQA